MINYVAGITNHSLFTIEFFIVQLIQEKGWSMQIVEVKSNLVKLLYDTAQERLILSGFVAIKDEAQSFIGQIINLEANTYGNFAIVKLLFNFNDEGVITNYNGSIPNVSDPVDIVSSQELIELMPVKTPILFGELAQQGINLNLDKSILEDKLLVCCEKESESEVFVNNLVLQLFNLGKKVLVFDFNGNYNFSNNKIIAGNDFKLPLNYETINFIYKKGLDNAAAETKALIQEVFLDLQEYVRTLPERYIPFETFKNVVDLQYDEMEMIELLLLKNKLLKYYEQGIFAQGKEEFECLKESLQNDEITIFDLSKVDSVFQGEMVSYAYSLMSELKEEVYVFCNVDEPSSDKKLLKQIFMAQNIYSTLISSYSFKYLKELKQLSKNMIFYAPIQKQDDFAIYNVFLAKLNPQEFLIYGQATHHIPFIVKSEKIQPQQIKDYAKQVKSQVADIPAAESQNFEADVLDEQIRRDVDELFTVPQSQAGGFVQQDIPGGVTSVQAVQDELTDEDLDYIDDLNIAGEGPIETVDDIVEDEEKWNADTFEDGAEDILAEETTAEEIESQEAQFEQKEPPIVSEIEPVEEVYANETPEDAAGTFSNVLQQQAQENLELSDELIAEPPVIDIIPASMSSTPIVPVYSADVESQVQSDELIQGDVIMHPKYGKGVVEKLISYGSKTLCSINFDNVGRRLLDPKLAELKKVE